MQTFEALLPDFDYEVQHDRKALASHKDTNLTRGRRHRHPISSKRARKDHERARGPQELGAWDCESSRPDNTPWTPNQEGTMFRQQNRSRDHPY